MILASTRQEIDAILDESYFGGANFSVAYGGAEHVYLSIKFIPNGEFSFWILRGNPIYPKFQMVMSPGPNILKDERVDARVIDECIKQLPQWVERVRIELLSGNPIAKEVQRFRQEVEEKLASMNEAMDAFFTKAEAEALSEKLASLHSRLEELTAQNSELQSSSSAMAATIAHLRATVTEVNKATWFRMASGKLTAYAKSLLASKEAREFALEAAKKVFLEGPK